MLSLASRLPKDVVGPPGREGDRRERRAPLLVKPTANSAGSWPRLTVMTANRSCHHPSRRNSAYPSGEILNYRFRIMQTIFLKPLRPVMTTRIVPALTRSTAG